METKLTDIEEIAQTDGKSAWLMVYADLITLVMIFFILLFSISRMNMERMTDVLKTFEIDFRTDTPSTSLFDLIDTGSIMEGKKLDHFIGMREVDTFQEIHSIIREKNLEKNMVATFVEGKIVLRIEGQVLFETGSADLLPVATRVLEGVIQIIKENPQYHVEIQGHTDNRPIHTPKFASNWELSAIRAATVLRHLIENGISGERLSATGFADLRPIASNDNLEERRKNRRVEFVLKEKE
jgi:chemotaxis protein MotB